MKDLRDLVALEPTDAAGASVGHAVTYASVEIGPEGAAEFDIRGKVVFVPREQILRIVLRKGIASERPLLQAVFGLLCFGVAGLACIMVAQWLEEGGTLIAETVTGFLMLPLGIGIFWALLRPRFFLRVETQKDARHLIFRGRVRREELKRFLNQAETTQSLPIEREVPGFARATPYRE